MRIFRTYYLAFLPILMLGLVACTHPSSSEEPGPLPVDSNLVDRLQLTLLDDHGWVAPASLLQKDTVDHFGLGDQQPIEVVSTPEPIRLSFFGWNQDDDYRFSLTFPESTSCRRCILSYTMCGWNKGPSQWDMLTEIFIHDKVNDRWFELQRAITPYGGSFLASWKRTYRMDVTHLLPLLQGETEFKIYYGGFDATDTRAHAVKLEFSFYEGNPSDSTVVWSEKLYDSFASGNNGYRAWAYGVPGYSIEDPERLGERELHVPAGVTTLILRACFTGHGQEALNEAGDGYAQYKGYFPGRSGNVNNPAEFDENWYSIRLNGRLLSERGYIWEKNDNNFKQAGTYQYDRAGWGPGKPANVHYWRITGLPQQGCVLTLDLDLDEYVSNRTQPNAGYVANYYVMVDAFGYK